MFNLQYDHILLLNSSKFTNPWESEEKVSASIRIGRHISLLILMMEKGLTSNTEVKTW